MQAEEPAAFARIYSRFPRTRDLASFRCALVGGVGRNTGSELGAKAQPIFDVNGDGTVRPL
jgi:hypothetical protein